MTWPGSMPVAAQNGPLGLLSGRLIMIFASIGTAYPVFKECLVSPLSSDASATAICLSSPLSNVKRI